MKASKYIAMFSIVLSTLVAISGCGSSNTSKLQSQIKSLQEQNQQLQSEVGSSTTSGGSQTSLQNIPGSSVPQFITINGQIKFPNSITIPNSQDDADKSNMMIGSEFQFVPSANWLVSLNGNTLHFQHPAMIWGDIKAFTTSSSANQLQESDMKNIVMNFFNGFPATNIQFRKVFMDTNEVGMLATAKVVVDKKPNVVNVGFALDGQNGVMFLFDYQDNGSGVQQELIDTLLTSGTIGQTQIKIE